VSVDVSQVPLQQSVSTVQAAPVAPAEVPPQVLSQVPQVPEQQSLAMEHVAPSALPEAPLHVLSQVPQLPEQQSVPMVHDVPSAPHVGPVSSAMPPSAPQMPPEQVPLQQSPSTEQASPSAAQPASGVVESSPVEASSPSGTHWPLESVVPGSQTTVGTHADWVVSHVSPAGQSLSLWHPTGGGADTH
jgi:hypothetical protein